MAFDPKPEDGKIYKTGDKRYRVVSFTGKEVVVVRLNTDDSEDSGPLTWEESKWNNKKLRPEGPPPPPPTESNSFTLDIDDDGNLAISQNGKIIKRLNVRGPEGKPGKDGMPGQDGATGQPGKDGAIGQPGRDGTPGKDGKDGEPGPEGKQGPTGPKGEDGIYWIPQLSDDGSQLRFVNRHNTTECTEWYPVKGAKGDTGGEGPRGNTGPAGPVYIPSVNTDGDLSWSCTKNGLPPIATRNIKGDKGEKGDSGATFHPIIKDGVLYWYDDNGKIARIEPTRISGPQGLQGKQGEQGLSAYEIWLKQGNLGTEKDFLESLRGEQGVPAPRADFSYQDVKDFTCEVQRIDTNLIVDSNKPTDSPAKIIDDRIQEIKKLREQGRQKRDESWFRKWSNWNLSLLIISIIVLIGTIVAACIIPSGSISTQTQGVSEVVDSTLVAADTVGNAASSIGSSGGVKWSGLIWCFIIIVVVLLGIYLYNRWQQKVGDSNSDEKAHQDTSEAANKTQKGNKIGLLKEFTWWCAGADKDLLAMCPGDHSKYVGIGTTILFTALMAVFSSFFAMRLVFGVDNTKLFEDWGNLGAFAVALVWGSMIFFLDRFITNTMYSDGKVSISKQEFLSGLPRMLIAIFIGIVIAAPLELKIFDKEVKGYLSSDYYTDKAKSLVLDDGQYKKAHDKYTSDSLFMETKRSVYDGYIKAQKKRDKKVFPKTKTRYEATGKKYQEVEKPNQPGKYDRVYVGTNYEMIIDTIGFDEKACNNSINMAEKEYHIADSIKSQAYNELCNIDSSLYSKYVEVLKDSCSGLFAHLEALHAIATRDYEPWWVSTNENGVVVISENGHPKGNFWDTILHSWWWYLLNSAIGLIMLLFILIDISPVLYKMMLADGKYDNYLHQEKLLAQDKIRLSLANMLKGLDDSELKRVAPFVMGDIYSKMAGDSFIYKTEAEFKKEMRRNGRKTKINLKDYEKELRKAGWSETNIKKRTKKIKCYNCKAWWYNALHIDMWRLWPISWLKALFWKSEEKPSAPVIVFAKKDEEDKSPYEKTQERIVKNLNDTNEDIFNEVLGMKKRIILASYRRWYKTQHDCIICDPVDDENKGKEPFEEDNFPRNDSKSHNGIDNGGQQNTKDNNTTSGNVSTKEDAN